MEKFVKVIATNKYKEISQAEFDANPSLYVDRTNRPVYIWNHHEEANVSYWRARKHCADYTGNLTNGFSDLNDADKEAMGHFAYGEQIDLLVAFYMSFYGINQQEAEGLNLQRVSLDRSKRAICAKLIVASPKTIEIGVKFLTVITNGEIDSSQAFAFTEAISGYLGEFERFAVLGINYGDEHDGVMDYFESTNSHDGGGLLIYTLNPAMVAAYGSEENARNAMIAELKDVYVEGNI